MLTFFCSSFDFRRKTDGFKLRPIPPFQILGHALAHSYQYDRITRKPFLNFTPSKYFLFLWKMKMISGGVVKHAARSIAEYHINLKKNRFQSKPFRKLFHQNKNQIFIILALLHRCNEWRDPSPRLSAWTHSSEETSQRWRAVGATGLI